MNAETILEQCENVKCSDADGWLSYDKQRAESKLRSLSAGSGMFLPLKGQSTL